MKICCSFSFTKLIQSCSKEFSLEDLEPIDIKDANGVFDCSTSLERFVRSYDDPVEKVEVESHR